MRTSTILGLGAGSLLAAGLGVVSWAVGIERRRFVLRELEVPVAVPGLAPLRILHLSDFHLAPGQRKKQRFVQRLAELEPDLIIATGDNLGHYDAIPDLADMLEPFRGIPTLSVFGSNDYYSPVLKNPFTYLMPKKPPVKRLRDLDEASLRELLFDDLGWVDLTNTAAIIEAGGRRIRAIGVDDPHIKVDRLDLAASRYEELSRGETWDLTLGLVHAPYQRILNPYAAPHGVGVGVDAILAGHTHGGQVCLPGKRAIVSNCDLPPVHAGGLTGWRVGDRMIPLHVSRGLGTSIYAPVRTFCPPEATLLTLVGE